MIRRSSKQATSSVSRLVCLSNPSVSAIQSEPLSTQLLTLLRLCSSTKSVLQIYAQMLVNSIQKPNFILPKFIDLKDFQLATRMFSHMVEPDGYAFNVMIRGQTTTWERFDLAMELYYEMRKVGVKADKFTYPFVLKACAGLGALDYGKLAHSMIFRDGLEKDEHVSHCLITMYSSCGEVRDARKVFDEIPVRDLVSWNTIISGYSKLGLAQEAVMLFGRMGEEGFRPDDKTVVSVLRACGDLGNLRLGKWIRDYVDKRKMVLDTFIGSSLIHMYCKCGEFSLAREVFDEMGMKDVVTWNAMITGYAQSGMSDEAIGLFHEMRKMGVEPNGVTLAGVLSSCGSIGALDLGEWTEKYATQKGIQFDTHVATALVDMYAKCGSLNEAFRIFELMPQKNDVSWNVMISAFAHHGRAFEALSLFGRMLNEGRHARPDKFTFVAVLSACVHAGMVDEGLRLYHLMSSSFGLVPEIEHYSCIVDLLARAGRVYEAWDFIEQMPQKPDGVILGALLGACQKLKMAEIGERVSKLLIVIEPSDSANYVISSKIYANEKRWNESAEMWKLMKQRGVTKIPGCSWVEIDGILQEFVAGETSQSLPEDTLDLILLLNEEMEAEGYSPSIDHL